MNRPKFSIIAVDYEHHVPRERMIRGLQSLANQTFKDFELIICHDGPKEKPYNEEIDFESMNLNPLIINTEIKHGMWGHPSRDKAMRIANGEYFLQFNIDNILYSNCLETIANNIENHLDYKIFIFSIVHHKNGNHNFQGIPPNHCNIDALQLVAHREIWKKNNYWHDYEESSDGIIYQKICSSDKWFDISDVLAENF